MQDDLLDVYGEATHTGKVHANDILRNKKTFLVTTFQTVADATDHQAYLDSLHTDFHTPAAKISYVKNLFDRYDIREQVSKQINAYYELAHQSLEAISLRDEGRAVLQQLQTWLALRNH